jgi:hypothetical protein
MDKAIRLKVKKELDIQQEKKVIQLKGALIAKAYTEIIHISDEGEEFYINSFVTLPEKKKEALDFIEGYLQEKSLDAIVDIL